MPAKCPEPARSSRGSSSSLYSPSSLGGSRSFFILSFESRRKPKFLYDFHHVAFLRPFAHALLLGGDGSPIFSLSMLWAKSPRDCVGSRGGSSSSYCSYYRSTNHQHKPATICNPDGSLRSRTDEKMVPSRCLAALSLPPGQLAPQVSPRPAITQIK